METTLGLFRHNVARILFSVAVCFLLSACDQKESSDTAQIQTNAQAEGVEKWMAKRAERRAAALSNPKESAAPAAPIEKIVSFPVEKAIAMTNVTPSSPIVAAAPVKSENDFSEQTSATTESSLPESSVQNVAAEPNSLSSQLESGYSTWKQGDRDQAFGQFFKAAEIGSAEAQLTVGMMYGTGEGVGQNYDEALKWITKALEQGNLRAQQLDDLKQFVNALEAADITEHHQQKQIAIAPPPVPFVTPVQTRFKRSIPAQAGFEPLIPSQTRFEPSVPPLPQFQRPVPTAAQFQRPVIDFSKYPIPVPAPKGPSSVTSSGAGSVGSSSAMSSVTITSEMLGIMRSKSTQGSAKSGAK
jgi:hypothetical protein